MVKIFTSIVLTLASVIAIVSAAPVTTPGPSPIYSTEPAPDLVPGLYFDHFFVIVLENMDYEDVINDSYMNLISRHGTLLSNYNAITHPSQPNYIAMISGSPQGYLDDDNHDHDVMNLVDLLESKNITWKSYQEDYPGDCFMKNSKDRLYRRKHNPFISFSNISQNETRCANIVESEELFMDIANNQLPGFSFYTPNMDNDGHDTDLEYASEWLDYFLDEVMREPNFTNRTAILITFDEDDSHLPENNNRVYSLLLGDALTLRKGTVDDTPYDHYSVLATIEKNWGLENLGAGDVGATPLII